MDGILKGMGLTAGTVGERMTNLGKQKRFLFPEGDEGRAQIMAYLQGRIADIRKRLPRAFATRVPGEVGDQAHATRGRAGCAGGVRRRWHDRWQGAGSILDQIFSRRADTVASACQRSPITSRFRVTCGRVSTRSSCHCPARYSLSTPTRKAGRFTPNSSPTNSVFTKAIRSGDWVICSRLHSVLVGSSSIRASTPNAGRASGQSSGLRVRTGQVSRK